MATQQRRPLHTSVSAWPLPPSTCVRRPPLCAKRQRAWACAASSTPGVDLFAADLMVLPVLCAPGVPELLQQEHHAALEISTAAASVSIGQMGPPLTPQSLLHVGGQQQLGDGLQAGRPSKHTRGGPTASTSGRTQGLPPAGESSSWNAFSGKFDTTGSSSMRKRSDAPAAHSGVVQGHVLSARLHQLSHQLHPQQQQQQQQQTRHNHLPAPAARASQPVTAAATLVLPRSPAAQAPSSGRRNSPAALAAAAAAPAPAALPQMQPQQQPSSRPAFDSSAARILSARLHNAGSLQQLQQLLAQHEAATNLYHTSIAMRRMAQLYQQQQQPGVGPESHLMQQQVMRGLLHQLEARSQLLMAAAEAPVAAGSRSSSSSGGGSTVTAQQLSGSMWAWATLQQQPGVAWMQQYWRCCAPLLPRHTPQQLAEAVWSLGKLQLQAPEPWWASFASAARQVLPSCTPQEVCMVLWGAVVLGQQLPAAWWRAAADQLEGSLQRWQPRDIAQLLWAVARMRPALPDGWLSRVVSHALQLLPSFPVRDITMVSWALARVTAGNGLQPLAAAWMVAALQQLQQQPSLMQHCKPQDVATLFWSSAVAGVVPPAGWQGLAWQAASPQRVTLAPQDAAMLLWSAVQLRCPPPGTWLSHLWDMLAQQQSAQHLQQQQGRPGQADGQYSLQQYIQQQQQQQEQQKLKDTVVLPTPELPATPVGLQQQQQPLDLRSPAHAAALSSQALVLVLWASVRLGHPPPASFRSSSLRHLQQHLEDLEPSAACQLLLVLSKTCHTPSSQFMGLLTARLQLDLHQLQPQGWAGVLAALGQLQYRPAPTWWRSAVAHLVPAVGGMSLRECVQVLWGCSRLRLRLPRSCVKVLQQQVLRQLLGTSQPAAAGGLTEQQQQQQQRWAAGGLQEAVQGAQALQLLVAAGWVPRQADRDALRPWVTYQLRRLAGSSDTCSVVVLAGGEVPLSRSDSSIDVEGAGAAGRQQPQAPKLLVLLVQAACCTRVQVEPELLLSCCRGSLDTAVDSSSSSRGPLQQMWAGARVALLGAVCRLASSTGSTQRGLPCSQAAAAGQYDGDVPPGQQQLRAAGVDQSAWSAGWLAVADAVMQQLWLRLPTAAKLQQLVRLLHEYRHPLQHLLTQHRLRVLLVHISRQPGAVVDVKQLRSLAAAYA